MRHVEIPDQLEIFDHQVGKVSDWKGVHPVMIWSVSVTLLHVENKPVKRHIQNSESMINKYKLKSIWNLVRFKLEYNFSNFWIFCILKPYLSTLNPRKISNRIGKHLILTITTSSKKLWWSLEQYFYNIVNLKLKRFILYKIEDLKIRQSPNEKII